MVDFWGWWQKRITLWDRRRIDGDQDFYGISAEEGMNFQEITKKISRGLAQVCMVTSIRGISLGINVQKGNVSKKVWKRKIHM
jgi:hypothetical protein